MTVRIVVRGRPQPHEFLVTEYARAQPLRTNQLDWPQPVARRSFQQTATDGPIEQRSDMAIDTVSVPWCWTVHDGVNQRHHVLACDCGDRQVAPMLHQLVSDF